MQFELGFVRGALRAAVVMALAVGLVACMGGDDSSSGGTVLVIDPAGSGGAGGDGMGAGGSGAVDGAGGAGGMETGTGGTAGVGGMNGTGGAGGAGGAGGEVGGPGGAGGVAGMMGGGTDEVCDSSEYTAVRQTFQESEDRVFRYVAYNSQVSQQALVTDVLLIEFHPARGFRMEPGVYDLAALGSDLDTCQICILSFQGINVRTGERRMNMMAVEGQVEITAFGDVGEAFQANLQGIQLRQVNISRDQLNRLVTDYPAGGETLCLDGYELDAERSPRPAMLNEPVRDFTLQNCMTEEVVSVGEIAASTRAVWFLGTAGWCGACSRQLTQGGRGMGPPLQEMESAGRENLRVMIVLGENRNRQPADLRFCRQYARSYADNAVDFYLDTDGTRAFPNLFGNLNAYTDANGMFGLPWNAVLSGGESPVYRYADRSGQPEAMSQIIADLTADPMGDGEMDMDGMDEPPQEGDGN